MEASILATRAIEWSGARFAIRLAVLSPSKNKEAVLSTHESSRADALEEHQARRSSAGTTGISLR